MAEQLYLVVPLELNLRSVPIVVPRAVLARLQQGQQVRQFTSATAPPVGWLWVQATLLRDYCGMLCQIRLPEKGSGDGTWATAAASAA